jgi:hypothetical protein
MRLCISFLCCFFLILLFSFSIAEEDKGISNGIEWSFKDGVLSLKGDEGFLTYDAPWRKYVAKTKELIIGSEFTRRATWDMFNGFSSLERVIIETDFFEGVFTESGNIKEVRYTSDNPVFVGHLFTQDRLEKIEFDNLNVDYVIEDKFLLNKSKTELFYYLGSDKEDVIVPEGVQIIHGGAFAQAQMKSIHLPSTLLEIREDAFSNTNFKSITIPESCRVIGWAAFSGNTALQEVAFLCDYVDFYCDEQFYDSSERRGGYTFAYCTSLQEITLPSCETVVFSFSI